MRAAGRTMRRAAAGWTMRRTVIVLFVSAVSSAVSGAPESARADASVSSASRSGHADAPVSPWVDPNDVAPPAWARSVAPQHGERDELGDLELFVGADRESGRRGVTAPGASLPFFGAKRGPGCTGRWWLVGPLAWTCSDRAELSASEPTTLPTAAAADGLGASYFFVRGDGADAYVSLDSAESGAPDRELEGGWGLAVVEQRRGSSDRNTRWGRTSHGLWVSMRDLAPARTSVFHGSTVTQGRVDFAWVVADRASAWSAPATKSKPVATRARFDKVTARDQVGDMVRVDDDAWMLSRDLAQPRVSEPPAEVTKPGERWIDVDLATQTLIAYEGTRPVYATLVSTGRGAQGTESATPIGVHRIWVKIRASDMDNVERDDASAHYSLEDVPNVQFFDGAVALHGTYWHGDFGHVRSHGCVNLAPLDAQWLFAFTEPKLPSGWVAAYPMAFDEGTAVRIR